MIIYPEHQLPDYYSTMYLDGYTPTEIWIAHHNTMQKEYEARQGENETICGIDIKSEIKIK